MIPVWAETGDFRDNNHHGLSTDHTSQLNFGSSRSRNRDRKGELYVHDIIYYNIGSRQLNHSNE